MELKDLFTKGSTLADVPPDFRGMPLKQWQRLEMAQQGERHRVKQNPEEAPLFEEAHLDSA